MSEKIEPALTPEEWEPYTRHLPEPAVLDADLILYEDGPHALAALMLHGQPFGFTWEVVDQLRESAAYIGRVEFVAGAHYAEDVDGEDLVVSLLAHADRIASFLPPRETA